MAREKIAGFGDYSSGNLPFRNQQLHDLSERIFELFNGQQTAPQYTKTVAPRNQLQKDAVDQLNKILASSMGDIGSYDKSKKNIQSYGERETHATVSPLLKEATRSPFSPQDTEVMGKFAGKYNNIGKAIQDEMSENYLKNIAPNVNYAYMTNGLWNSPLRNKHQKDVIRNLHKDVARELARVKTQGFEKSLEHIGQQKERGLQGAQLTANILEKEKEAGLAAERAAQDTEKGKLFHNIALNEQQRSLGNEQQAQTEAELRQQHEDERHVAEFEEKKLSREAAMLQGLPVQGTFAYTTPAQPRPVSGAHIGAGTLASVIGQMYPQQQQGKKKGGTVKKYAPGGEVTITPPAHTLSPELQQAMALMQENRQNKPNPTGKAFSALGAHLLSTVGDDPIRSFGSGLKKFNQTQTAHESENSAENLRQINTLNAIHQSRVEQDKIIRDFEHKKSELEETKRAHNAQIGLHGAHADLLRAQTDQINNHSTLGGGSGYLPKGVRESEEHKQQIKLNSKLEEKDLERRAAVVEAKDRLSALKESVEGGLGYTGPGGSIAPHALATLNSGTIANRRSFEAENINELANILQKMKGTQSDNDMAVLQRSLPSLSDTPETINKFISKFEEAVNRSEQGEKFIENSVKNGKNYLEAEKEWQQMCLKRPLFAKKENAKKDEMQSHKVDSNESEKEKLKRLYHEGKISREDLLAMKT